MGTSVQSGHPAKPREEVGFARKERDVLELLRDRIAIKDIAGLLEISANTVRERIRRSCEIAQVIDETELMLFLFQNPHILERGSRCAPGLHIPIMRSAPDSDQEKECECGNPECLGWAAMHLKMANAEVQPKTPGRIQRAEYDSGMEQAG
jgi:DNA-binding CsgD family transcriptional regulator